MKFFELLASKFPDLDFKLRQAGIDKSPKDFMKMVLISSLYISLGIVVFLFFIFFKLEKNILLLLVLWPILFFLSFFYIMKYPDMKRIHRAKNIEKDLISAGRHILIELESGITIFDALVSVSEGYGETSREFKKIVEEVNMGSSLEKAFDKVLETNPSNGFRRICWQIINSLRTGSDIASSLKIVIDQLTEEQIIEIKNYGKTLNPLAMFYMILAVVIPSLGVSMMLIFSSFFPIPMSMGILLFLVFFLGFIQFMFVSVAKSTRPTIST